MSDNPWFGLYIGDYLADTSHLSTVQHGAYLLLTMHYYRRLSLPEDDEQLARIARLSAARWRKMKPVIQAFFFDGWKHERIEKELAKREEKSRKNSEAGKASAESKAKAKLLKEQGTPSTDVDATLNERTNETATKGQPSQSQSQSQSNKQASLEKVREEGVKKAGREPRHGKRSKDGVKVYWRAGTPEFKAYEEDFRTGSKEVFRTNPWGGRWFNYLGEKQEAKC